MSMTGVNYNTKSRLTCRECGTHDDVSVFQNTFVKYIHLKLQYVYLCPKHYDLLRQEEFSDRMNQDPRF